MPLKSDPISTNSPPRHNARILDVLKRVDLMDGIQDVSGLGVVVKKCQIFIDILNENIFRDSVISVNISHVSEKSIQLRYRTSLLT